MRKLRMVVIALLAIVLSSCMDEKLPDDELAKVSISKSTGFGSVNTHFIKEYEDEEFLEIFHGAITTAVRNEGIVDMAAPEFDLQVVDTAGNKHGYHLWLGQTGQNSTLMDVKDTHTIYSISEDFTDSLSSLIRE